MHWGVNELTSILPYYNSWKNTDSIIVTLIQSTCKKPGLCSFKNVLVFEIGMLESWIINISKLTIANPIFLGYPVYVNQTVWDSLWLTIWSGKQVTDYVSLALWVCKKGHYLQTNVIFLFYMHFITGLIYWNCMRYWKNNNYEQNNYLLTEV